MSSENLKTGDESVESTVSGILAPTVVDNLAGNLQDSVGAKVDGVLEDTGKIDLGIDWDSLDKESLFAGLEKFDQAEDLYPKVPGNKHDTYVLYAGELNTSSGEKVVLKVSKVISPNFHEIQIEIVRPSIDAAQMKHHHVAAFEFLQRKGDGSEEWDMKHRETSAPYRGQGIAGKAIGLLEEALKKRGENNNLGQSISAISGQKDFTEWLEKRGFKAAGPKDLKKLQRLKSGDSDLQEVMASGDTYAAGETYTFDRNEFGARVADAAISSPEDPAVWDDDNYGKPFFYMDSSFRIKLKKEV